MGETTRTMIPGDASPSEIRNEIDRTQARLGETLEELERRLSPRQVYERAREATHRVVERAGDRGREVVRQVDDLGRGRVAGAAAGSLAAAWLLARKLRSSRSHANGSGRPPMTRVHSDPIDEAGAAGTNNHGRWTSVTAVLGAAGLMLAAYAANRREEQRSRQVQPVDSQRPTPSP
jgi:Protein of unknown function (DUF3618)